MTRLLPLLALLSTSCGPWMTEGDFFYLHRAGADMPVLVRGNLDSGTFVVILHGGPGGSGLAMGLSPGMQLLEEEVAVVYWDQRFSGMSQGNPSPDTITIPDFVADTDAVISLVLEKYEVEDLFVYGHSWGGDLALATLTGGSHVEDVNAWIVDGGAHDEFFAVNESRTWVVGAIERHLAEGIDVELWSEAAEWYDANPVLQPDNAKHYLYVNMADGYFYDPSVYIPPDVVELALDSPFSLGVFQNQAHDQRLVDGLLGPFDVSAELPLVRSPVLVMGGELDGCVPLPVAEEIYALLGTDPADKRHVALPMVAHMPRDEAPEEFAELVLGFMADYQ